MNKNKLIYIVLLIVIVLGAIYVLKPKKEEKVTNIETLATSIAPLKWVVSEIAGNKFNVVPIVSSNVSHESFEPDVHSIEQLEKSKLFFYYDNFKFEEALENVIKDDSKIVNVLEGVNKDLFLKDKHGNDVLVIGEHDEDKEESEYDILFESLKGYKHTDIDFESNKDFTEVKASINEKAYDLIKISDKPLTFKDKSGKVKLVLTKDDDKFLATLMMNNETIKLAQQDEDEEHEHHHDHGKGGIDPHIWFSMPITKQVAKNILDKLVATYPNDKATFEKNYSKFINKINEFEKTSKEKLNKIGKKSFIIYHPALEYFIKGSKLYELPIELEGKEPSAKAIKEIIEEANEHKVKVIFVQPQFSTESAKAIAKEIKGVRVVEFNIDNENVIDSLNFFLDEMQK